MEGLKGAIDIKETFDTLTEVQKQTRLMETAMRITEIFCDMSYACQLNPDKVDYYDSIERLQMFADWTREFEHRYCGTKEYEDDFIGLSDEFAQRKLKEVFGVDD